MSDPQRAAIPLSNVGMVPLVVLIQVAFHAWRTGEMRRLRIRAPAVSAP